MSSRDGALSIGVTVTTSMRAVVTGGCCTVRIAATRRWRDQRAWRVIRKCALLRRPLCEHGLRKEDMVKRIGV